ncbi:unnamed protein product [Calicophoron daubneyi]
MDRTGQHILVQNMTHWIRKGPFMLHGHFAYINFPQFGSEFHPIYINMIRDPLDRLVSHYYFLRFGDDYRPGLIRKRMKDPKTRMQTFDECVQNGGLDCHPNNLWLQVPFFCGHAAYCKIPGNPAAVESAKQHFTENYLFVGLTEAFEDSVHILEKLLPQFFSGASNLLKTSDRWHLRRTKGKLPVQEATRTLFQGNPVWQAEQDFYQFVRAEFYEVRKTLLQSSSNHIDRTDRYFRFVKIRPKSAY